MTSTSAGLNFGVGERKRRSVELDRIKNEEVNEENIPLTSNQDVGTAF